MKIIIGSDHAGFHLKEDLKNYLSGVMSENSEIVDVGTTDDSRCDYPDVAHILCQHVIDMENQAGKSDPQEVGFGIIICGSGIGMSMACNRYEKIRCALCCHDSLARLARQHNNANVIALGARFLTVQEAITLIKTFWRTPFEGGRHQMRVDKLLCYSR